MTTDIYLARTIIYCFWLCGREFSYQNIVTTTSSPQTTLPSFLLLNNTKFSEAFSNIESKILLWSRLAFFPSHRSSLASKLLQLGPFVFLCFFINQIGHCLTCSPIDPRKPHSKTPKTHLSTAFWSWYSRKFSKMNIFIFPNYLEILFFFKLDFMAHLVFLTCFSVDPREQNSKISKTTSLHYILKLIFPEIFKNESFRFSQYSQNFFSGLCLGSSDRLTNCWDILKSVGKGVEKF